MSDRPASGPTGTPNRSESRGLVVDLGPVRDLSEALDALERRWAALPPPLRLRLSRLVWLHPGGEVVVYRPPEEEPCPFGS